jgi:hypothetical protein
MKTILQEAVTCTVWSLTCALVGLFLPPVWPHFGAGNRFLPPQALNVGMLIGSASFVFRSRLSWPVLSLFLSLLPIECILYFSICYFSGFYTVNSFNLHWFLGLNIFLAIPWFIGTLLGTVFLLSFSPENRRWENKIKRLNLFWFISLCISCFITGVIAAAIYLTVQKAAL